MSATSPRNNSPTQNGTNDGRLEDRTMLFDAIREAWDSTDQRFVAARVLLRHDNNPGSEDPLRYETMGLLCGITGMALDMIILRGEHPDREDLHKIANELRDATDRLNSIIYAVTASVGDSSPTPARA